MTQPTQAQIEASEMQAFGASEFACYKWPEDTLEHKALRSAFIEGAALTAAAEVGDEQSRWDSVRLADKDCEIGRLKNELAATIERCAQVVDGLAKKANRSEITKLEEAAAAIRALKGQP